MNIRRTMILVSIFLVGAVVPVLAEADPQNKSTTRAHFQMGLFGKIAGNENHQREKGTLVTAEMNVLFEKPTRPTWGFGFRVTADEDVFRFGLKGLVRFPLDEKKRFYFQFAPGVYLAGSSDYPEMKYPGLFAEAEIGYTRMLAAVVAVEYLPYSVTLGTRVGDQYVRHQENGSFTGGYVGVKAGQLPGWIALVGLLVAGAIVAASYSGFGS